MMLSQPQVTRLGVRKPALGAPLQRAPTRPPGPRRGDTEAVKGRGVPHWLRPGPRRGEVPNRGIFRVGSCSEAPTWQILLVYKEKFVDRAADCISEAHAFERSVMRCGWAKQTISCGSIRRFEPAMAPGSRSGLSSSGRRLIRLQMRMPVLFFRSFDRLAWLCPCRADRRSQ
jgi:hypothetical protein